MICSRRLMTMLGLLALALAVPAGAVDAKLWPARIGKTRLKVEVADSHQSRAMGLMNRKALPADQGMLFVFEQEQLLTFWMKNTFIPLSIAFLGRDLRIVDIQEMRPVPVMVVEPPRYTSRAMAIFALEMNQGWFARHGIKVGDELRFDEKRLPDSVARIWRPGLKSKSPTD